MAFILDPNFRHLIPNTETVSRVREYILSDPEVEGDVSRFVEGWGWDHTRWLLSEWPNAVGLRIGTRELFSSLLIMQDHLENDPAVKGRKVVLQSKDGHALWVSKAVIETIDSLPHEIQGGVIVRDKNGNPTGGYG